MDPFDGQMSGRALETTHGQSLTERMTDRNLEMTMTKRRIGVSLVTFVLALGLSPTLVQADDDSVREKKKKIEKAQDLEKGDVKGKTKEAAKEEAKDEARDAARDAADLDKKGTHR
jgi:hypothetical protein